MPITSGAHPKALRPGVNKFWVSEVNKHPMFYEQMFDVFQSKKSYEEDVELTGFGYAPVKDQLSGVSYEDTNQGPTSRYTHVVYGKGYVISKEAIDDNLYDSLSRSFVRGLALSMVSTKETVAANVYNRAFNASYAGGDGVQLISTAHPTEDGTQANRLAVDADFSEAALEDMLVLISNMKNSKGLFFSARANKIVIPPALEFEVQRVLGSVLQSGTANNDINAHKSLGMLPGGHVATPYLTNSKSWYIRTNVPDGLKLFMRTPVAFTSDNDFDTENAKAKAVERYVPGWTNHRGIVGSAGAA